jgi:hypothetical protein
MRVLNPELQSTIKTLALALMLAVLWLLLRGYHGLTGDGRIYAFQALARLHPELGTDLYLQNSSQDRFTLFSPLYAWCVGLLGLENSARLLTLLFTLWFMAAVWSFARAVAGWDAAWAALAFLLIAAGNYGGSGVFRILEPFLTARLPAQAMIVTALYCQVRGMRWLGLALAMAALLIHPLMALPGLLLIICLWLPLRLGVIGAIGGVFATLALAVAAVAVPTVSHILTVMDAPWLDVVRERSQFLFLQLWAIRDWGTNAQPFVFLGFTVIVISDERIRKICATGALVGAAGLTVAFIGGLIGPVAILVQGQAWRWVWITVLVSVVLLPVTALKVWRDDKCGSLCALLLVLGWTVPGIEGTASVALASLLWLTRSRISSRTAKYFRWVSVVLGIAIGIWILIKSQTILSLPTPPSAQAPLGMTQIQDILDLKIPAVLLGALMVWGLHIINRTWVLVLLAAMLAGFAVFLVPAGFKQSRTLASSAEIQEFAGWESVIPPTSTVLVTPPHDVGAFVWFTLGRPNYLGLDQSAGVVYSRATALEVRRRSEVLLPLMDPDWKILTNLRAKSGSGRKHEAISHPLTSRNLIQVCADPQLGFIISPGNVGFDPMRHEHTGAWKDWNLYDCRKVRSTLSAT